MDKGILKIPIKIEVAFIDERMRKSHLKSFGHVQRRAISAPKKKEFIQVERTKKDRRIPKITKNIYDSKYNRLDTKNPFDGFGNLYIYIYIYIFFEILHGIKE